MVFIMLITLYPAWYIVVASLSNSNMLMQHDGFLLRPLDFTLETYRRVLQNAFIIRSFFNTVYIVVFGTIINMVMTTLSAYVLSRQGFYWKKAITVMIVITMFFSGGLIPIFLNIQRLGLYDTYWALVLPGAISTYNLFIMRAAFNAVPDSLDEIAEIEGANNWQIFTRIYLPLSMATITVLILYYGVAHWNSWFSAMIYIRKNERYPLQLILRSILILNDTQMGMSSDVSSDRVQSIGETIKYGVIVFSTAPILLVYPFLQKYFVKGVMLGAIKG